MQILINENAAGNYIKRCYKHARPEAYGLHNENFYNILKNVQGNWLSVETEHLFSDQFNTAPIDGVKCQWCYGYDKDNDGACDKCGKTEYLKPLNPRTI